MTGLPTITDPAYAFLGADLNAGPLKNAIEAGFRRGFVLSTDYRALDAIQDVEGRIDAIRQLGVVAQYLMGGRMVEAREATARRPWWRFW